MLFKVYTNGHSVYNRSLRPVKYLMRRAEVYVECPVVKAWRILGRPWRLVIIERLLHGPRKFNDLLWSMPGISSRTLSKALRELEELGIVARKTEGRHVYYYLTEKGRDLAEVVEAVRKWAEKWMPPRAAEQ